METFYLKKVNEVKRLKPELEKKLNVKIKTFGNSFILEGSSLDEYEASLVFDAIKFGFSINKALMLKNEENIFKIIHIKNHTRRNLRDVKARLIGTKGKTKKIISEITNCELVIADGDVGIIGDAESIKDTERAIINLIKGSKQSNIYRYLEKMNRIKKRKDSVLKE